GANGDRGHQHGVTADEGVFLHHRTVFVLTVVVTGDGAGAHIDIGPDGRIPDITEMSHDGPGGRLLGFACGTLSGFTSFVAHAGGAPMKFYILPQRLDKRLFVGTNVVFFFIVNQLKIWPYLWLGQFSPENLLTSLVLAPAVPVGVWIGWRINRILPMELFYKICYGLLFVVGVKLIWDGLMHGG
ncbi:MAG: sulfite exporter TauE/SafE family protein, partial [Proteobacteria bacterium]|nr:sulfite exporter TauE/SafE family protein [Pseudomonadota bacterium]